MNSDGTRMVTKGEIRRKPKVATLGKVSVDKYDSKIAGLATLPHKSQFHVNSEIQNKGSKRQKETRKLPLSVSYERPALRKSTIARSLGAKVERISCSKIRKEA